MNNRIKELAEQSGLIADGEDWFSAIQETDVRSIDLERFAELVRQDEREVCLAIVETHPTVREMSVAIRARSKHD